MHLSRFRALTGVVAALACGASIAVVGPASAAPTITTAVAPLAAAPKTKLGPVRQLKLEITKPSAQYRMVATWEALPQATSYRVTLSSAGTVLDSGKLAAVADPRWTSDRPVLAGSTVTVKVVPLAAKRPGIAATASAVVPDVTAPVGAYTVALPEGSRTATVTQTSLRDDVTAAAAIKREIDWGAGAGFEPWPTGDVVEHSYPAGKQAYHPVVRLTDEAGNVALVALAAVAIDDTEKPEGAFTAAPAKAWAKYTKVAVTQVGELSDDVSAPANIKRSIAWGDGTTSEWTSGSSIQHVYAAVGSFQPVVKLTDEAGKTREVTLRSVAVAADTVAPKASLAKPATKRARVRSWMPLRGFAKDSGTGVRKVIVRAVEKRRGAWFAYQAPTRSWVKAGTKTRAWRASRPAAVPSVNGAWRYRVAGLRPGQLVIRVRARDNVGNLSAVKTYGQLLKRR